MEREFLSLNPRRKENKRIPLNPNEQQYLIDNFFNFPKGYRRLCKKCLCLFAKVSPKTLKKVHETEVKRRQWGPFQNPKKRGRKPLPRSSVAKVTEWATQNSLPDPTAANKRFFPAQFRSKRHIYRSYRNERINQGENYVSRSTFWKLRDQYFRYISVGGIF